MNGQQITALASTFCIGFLAGIYLFLVGFSPIVRTVTDAVSGGDRTALYEDLTIEAVMYGSCPYMYGCPSFQVRGDRQFSIVNGDSDQPRSGELPLSLWRPIERLVTEPALRTAAAPRDPEGCPSAEDGADVAYTVTYNGKEYELDTCQTDLYSSRDLRRAFDNVWDYLLNYES